jgi:hypothetical protein
MTNDQAVFIGHWDLVIGHLFSGIATIVESRGCSTTARMRVLVLADGFFDTRCRHPVGS